MYLWNVLRLLSPGVACWVRGDVMPPSLLQQARHFSLAVLAVMGCLQQGRKDLCAVCWCGWECVPQGGGQLPPAVAKDATSQQHVDQVPSVGCRTESGEV